MAEPGTLSEKLNRIAAHPWVVLACRLVIGVSLIYASLDKISHPDRFAEILRGYELLPARLVRPFAHLVPWGEILIGAALILGVFTRVAAVAGAALFGVFAGAVASAVLRGLEIACGCFTTKAGAEPANWTTVSRSLFFLLLSLLVVSRRGEGPLALDFYLKKRRGA
jgi:uncharacterized membrane protein YphA (DoxX/SURF4 family)